MNRLPNGTMYRRGRRFWYQYKYQKRKYAYSLKTTNEIQAAKEFEHRMTCIRAAIMEDTFYEKFDHDRLTESPALSGGRLKLADMWKVYLNCSTRPASGASTLKQYEYQVNDFTEWMKTAHPKVQYLSQVTQAMAGQ